MTHLIFYADQTHAQVPAWFLVKIEWFTTDLSVEAGYPCVSPNSFLKGGQNDNDNHQDARI
ncbi:MAG: hypothetical protein KME16_14650 [Scytolyngbya sp. HA4215-MV1]|nr:hypothetical protein [Scytolyngbya sp. HA4215-MV1]